MVERARMELCANCGEKKVVFVIANKWRCKACGKYFDWTEMRKAKEQARS
jgi:ribosomal protein L37AE/L43A